MNPTPNNPLASGAVGAPVSNCASYEETLRLVAQVPVPEGLEERVHAALLRSAPRHSRVLSWPFSLEPKVFWAGSGWVRATAAAAIVFVVVGGGWGVYRRVEHPMAKVIVMPVAQPAPGAGFSSAGAMRTPQTVQGPVLVQPTAKARKQSRKKVPPAAPAATAQPASIPAAGAVTAGK